MPKEISADSIYQMLEKEIVSLTLRPGEVLSENAMCKRFGVSRTPVRSALQRLEQNGFVRILPHRGTVVTPIDLRVVDQFIYQRVAIESMVLRDFVSSCTPPVVEEARYRLEQMERAAAHIPDPERFDFISFLKLDLAMHEVWFRATGKMFLWQTLTRPQADYARFIRLDIVGARNVPEVLRDHREMMRIIDEKDVPAIEPLMRHHLYGGVRRMGGKLYSEEYRTFFQQSMPAE